MFVLFFTALAVEVLLDILRPKSTFNKLFFVYLGLRFGLAVFLKRTITKIKLSCKLTLCEVKELSTAQQPELYFKTEKFILHFCL